MLKIKAPCSSANLGPGFDCLGIAFDIYNHFTFEPSQANGYIGFAEKYCNDGNLVFKAYKTASEKLGKHVAPVTIGFHGDVPAARGLGSSSTCIAAGVVAAFELNGAEYDKNDVAYLAGLIEGHPDNVAPCVYGGLTDAVVVTDDEKEKLIVQQFDVSDKLCFYALIPDFELSTKQSRDVLPRSVPLTSAKRNVANVPLLLKAFATGDVELLSYAAEDWLHQPFRGEIIDGYFQIKQMGAENGVVTMLSGAGPTMLAVCDKDVSDVLVNIVSTLKNDWQIKRLKVDLKGLEVTK